MEVIGNTSNTNKDSDPLDGWANTFGDTHAAPDTIMD